MSGYGARVTEDNLLGNSQGLLIGSLSFLAYLLRLLRVGIAPESKSDDLKLKGIFSFLREEMTLHLQIFLPSRKTTHVKKLPSSCVLFMQGRSGGDAFWGNGSV